MSDDDLSLVNSYGRCRVCDADNMQWCDCLTRDLNGEELAEYNREKEKFLSLQTTLRAISKIFERLPPEQRPPPVEWKIVQRFD